MQEKPDKYEEKNNFDAAFFAFMSDSGMQQEGNA